MTAAATSCLVTVASLIGASVGGDAPDLDLFIEPPTLATGLLGSVDCPSAAELSAMHEGDYVFRAHDGRLCEVRAQKSRIPRDPQGHVQHITVDRVPDGAIYVLQATTISKSTDGGRSWTTYEHAHPLRQVPERQGGRGILVILADGTFISVLFSNGSDKAGEPAIVWASDDEGRTWHRRAEFMIDAPEGYADRYETWVAGTLPDGTILWGLELRGAPKSDDPALADYQRIVLYRSSDAGATWEGPAVLPAWTDEGGIAALPSGRLLATLRYQRPVRASDPPNVHEITSAAQFNARFPYKHVFLADSDNEGRTWGNLRQLTTVHGQCYGHPVAMSHGTVVVVHDTRYGPGVPSGRAMVSRDEGATWEDEAYYLFYGDPLSGYAQSLLLQELEEDVILTIAGTSDHDESRGSWGSGIGTSDQTAIRWTPIRD